MRLFLPIATFFLFATGAFAQSNEVAFRFEHRVGGQPLALDTTVFTLPDGRKALLKRAEFYIAETVLTATDGSKLPLDNFYMLVNANTPNRTYEAGNWNVSGISGLTLHLGVDAAHNHLDPSAYPAGHPLANQNPTMHWGWTAGYRFMAIEGLLDKNGDNVPETIFQYHNLGDSLYQTVELVGTETVQNGTLLIRLKLDYTRLFEKLDMTGNLTQHGSGPVNAAMMKNAASPNFIGMGQASAASALALQSDRVSLSPNPARSSTTVRYDLDATGPLRLALFDAAGRTVREFGGLQKTGVLELPLDGLPKGAYQCAFFQNSQLLAGKTLAKIE
ncbi:MAG: MbnP family protein [Saprospiraceae bacterium]